MKRTKVIKPNQLPVRLPFTPTLAWYLLLDKLHAPGWVWGVFGAFFGILWIGLICALCIQDAVEVKDLCSPKSST